MRDEQELESIISRKGIDWTLLTLARIFSKLAKEHHGFKVLFTLFSISLRNTVREFRVARSLCSTQTSICTEEKF